MFGLSYVVEVRTFCRERHTCRHKYQYLLPHTCRHMFLGTGRSEGAETRELTARRTSGLKPLQL